MEFVKVKVLAKCPMVSIDNHWFPYRNIVNTEELDGEMCAVIEEAIEAHGMRKVTVYYNIEERDGQSRPTKIRVGCAVEGKPYDGHECVFHTIYDKKPLQCTHFVCIDPNVDPFIYKRFMEPGTYISKGDD